MKATVAQFLITICIHKTVRSVTAELIHVEKNNLLITRIGDRIHLERKGRVFFPKNASLTTVGIPASVITAWETELESRTRFESAVEDILCNTPFA